MEFRGRFIFGLFIAIHILSAVIPIRSWPLTDYPMFSKAHEPFRSLSRLLLEFVDENGVERRWARGDYMGFGAGDYRLQGYVDDPDNPRLRELISEKVAAMKSHWHVPPQTLKIIRVTYTLGDDSEFHFSSETLREIPVASFL